MTTQSNQPAALGFEHTLWEATDLLRNSVDPVEYKHTVPGLISEEQDSNS